jgi:hypothetical protein
VIRLTITGHWPISKLLTATLFGLVLAGAAPAAAVECSPYCDYTHDYGPYDLTWARPGLYAWPVCGPGGNCSPYAVYSYPRRRGVHILVRPRGRTSYQ